MKGKRYQLHILRSIRQSLGRFFAIFGIVLLGVGFMAGMLSCSPDMRLSCDAYFDDSNFYDIRVMSTLGITEEDVLTLKKTDGVRGVMPCYTADAIVDSDTGVTKVARFASLPFSLLYPENENYINQIELLAGRMPENENEAVLVRGATYLDTFKIGDTLAFSPENADLSGTFAVKKLTIVGVVKSPCYFSIDKQSSKVGSGTVDVDLFVREESFCMETYTEAYVNVVGSKKYNSFENDYDLLVYEVADSIAEQAGARCSLRRREVNEQLRDAKRELNEGKKELYAAKGELTAAKKQITLMEEAIPPIEDALEAGRSTYSEGLETYNDMMDEAEATLSVARNALTEVKLLVAVADQAIASAQEELDRLREEGNEQAAELLQTQFDNLLVYYDGLLTKLDEANKQYEDGLKTYKTAKKEAESMLSEAERTIADYETQLGNAKTQLHDAKAAYAEGLAAYEANEAAAQEQFDDAQKKIDETERMLEEIGTPQWYVLTRDDEAGFSGFAGNADRIGAIARVFPVFFFLVAALVALTTMTRMIEEERTQIGTLKALGYRKNAIAAKYLIYSESATVLGAAIGIFIGIRVLPRVIWNTYGMMYMLPEVRTPFYPLICLLAAGVAALCTFAATYFACRSSLAETPARLMLPKAPKAGKTIFLERLGFLWKRLSFIQKVTARNLLRYKKRFFMTVFGIAGCTALLLTGFGLRDSISDIINKQFTELHTYDGTVALKDNLHLDELKETAANELSDSLLCYQVTATVGEEDENLFVYSDAEKFPSFVNLRERKSHKSIPAGDTGAVITEKMAATLGVKQGDTISVTANGRTAKLTVLGVAENYVYGYVYISESLYHTLYGELPSYNAALIKLKTPESRHTVATALLQNESVAQISFVPDLIDTFSDMLDKVNTVVWVLIVAAAMLAFVVLYNLININITERRREIATLKVLGFRRSETYAYIFRETTVLVVIGAALGLVFGIFLWMFVVKTAEVDMVMFGREITWVSYVISALLTFLFAALVFIAMVPKLKKIDMVESLKANE